MILLVYALLNGFVHLDFVKWFCLLSISGDYITSQTKVFRFRGMKNYSTLGD
jgi:hypothetical protein